ncbi:hypothetical protein [Paenibacillus puerhi]|uniref:hypothetical protein n=1 Tax=Paenibacillus puerhi TaxID=2692622 RepID=UPI001359AC87|nr:hypothetical protein [Paenibacillus puerhi]
MKKLVTMFISLVAVFSMATSAFAVTGEGAVRVATTSSYYGISGYLTIPSNVYVSNDGSFIAFYLGLANTCEGGISYKPSTGWNKFLNCGSASGSNATAPLTNQPTAGTQINLKLVNNLDNTASLYINGVEAYTLPAATKGALVGPTIVKTVHSTLDNQDKNKYSNAAFSSLQVKNAAGSYVAFPSAVSVTYPWGIGEYTVHSTNPLKTSLAPGL